MRWTEWLQETRLRRFEQAYEGWTEKRLTQIDAARLLGVCPRTFRRTIDQTARLNIGLGLPRSGLYQA